MIVNAMMKWHDLVEPAHYSLLDFTHALDVRAVEVQMVGVGDG